MMTRDDVLACLTSLLVENKLYRIKIHSHESEATFVKTRKALVKDFSTITTKVGDKWPYIQYVEFSEFTLLLNLDAIKTSKVTAKGIELKYDTYSVRIEHANHS